MAINETRIKLLLEYLEGEIKTIEESKVTEKILKENENSMITDATKHRVQIAIEAVINISEHIVAGLKLGKPEYAKELFPVLVRENIIEKDLANNLSNAVGLRNVLVHLYTEVDLGILANSATTDLDDLRKFAKAIYSFLESLSKKP